MRLLVSNPPESLILKDAGNSHIELGLDEDNELCRVDLLEVVCGNTANMTLVEKDAVVAVFPALKVSPRQ